MLDDITLAKACMRRKGEICTFDDAPCRLCGQWATENPEIIADIMDCVDSDHKAAMKRRGGARAEDIWHSNKSLVSSLKSEKRPNRAQGDVQSRIEEPATEYKKVINESDSKEKDVEKEKKEGWGF